MPSPYGKLEVKHSVFLVLSVIRVVRISLLLILHIKVAPMQMGAGIHVSVRWICNNKHFSEVISKVYFNTLAG